MTKPKTESEIKNQGRTQQRQDDHPENLKEQGDSANLFQNTTARHRQDRK